ncbi:class I SAM-dependent methyltransferase [Streptomyces sp. NPDC048644]|uniref:class I SAM-dependent methyltransferase n=1 Tax=Streptomyces sp. NPDC048644 TaxID=3365582 RepID=UPI00371BD65C
MTQQPPPDDAGHPEGPDLPDRVTKVYGDFDLSTVAAFAGGFINFGYWARMPHAGHHGPLTEADRIRSEQDLYRLVLDTFARTDGCDALEVGCGRGLGSALALQEYGFASVTGLDAHPDQIARARRTHPDLSERPGTGRLEFVRGAAQRIPLPDASVDCVFSVEAVQHFRNLPGFAQETARVLRPHGRLALTTFFARTPGAAQELPGLLPAFADGLDVPHVVDEVTQALAGAGLAHVRIRSVGDGVWECYDRYMAERPELRDKWPRRYLTAYRDGLLDYYLLTAAATGR